MADPLVAAAGAVGKAVVKAERSEGILKRVLGPPADALGETLARWVEFRTQNVGRILDSADRKLGSKGEQPGAVPLRIAAQIFEDGSYCDDEVMVEYLGGVLASSRSDVSRDDRGARWASLVTSLSSYELRLHYVLYATARRCYIGSGKRTKWGDGTSHVDLDLVIDWEALNVAMEFSPNERGWDICGEEFFSLNRENLVDAWYMMNKAGFLEHYRRTSPWPEIVGFSPTPLGVNLFLWAQGYGGATLRAFDNPKLVFPELDIDIPAASLLVDLPSEDPNQPSGD